MNSTVKSLKCLNRRVAALAIVVLLLSLPVSLSMAASDSPQKPTYGYGTISLPPGVPDEVYEGRLPGPNKDFALEELVALDPSTFPQMVLIEDEWEPYIPCRDYMTDQVVEDARRGNPFALICIASRFIGFDSKAYNFWIRMADSLTAPGWGYAVSSLSSRTSRSDLDKFIGTIKGIDQQCFRTGALPCRYMIPLAFCAPALLGEARWQEIPVQ